MTQFLIKLITCYQKWISPLLKQLLGTQAFCKYPQTCSEYAIMSIKKYGSLHGGVMAFGRILSCQPFLNTFSKNKSLKFQ